MATDEKTDKQAGDSAPQQAEAFGGREAGDEDYTETARAGGHGRGPARLAD